jgi:hypothetical protein
MLARHLDGFATEQLRRLSNKLTRLIGLRWGNAFPFWYICEYPKSGGTWLGHMLADYLQLPFPQSPALPLAMACVVHNHWLPHPRLQRCFYLYRDGRDVMVSYYFHRLRECRSGALPFERAMARRFERLFGPDYAARDPRRNMARYIELEMSRPRGSRLNWPAHVAAWCFPRHDHVAYLAYEELLAAPVVTLARCLEKLDAVPVDHTRLRASVERYAFARVAGRPPGHEDRSTFLRKGIAGDWLNYFTREAAEVFDYYAGDALINLGYEGDRSWVTSAALPSEASLGEWPPDAGVGARRCL